MTGGSAASGVSNSVDAPGADAARKDERPRRLHDLGPRVGSALVLAPAAIAATVAGGPWLAAATGAASVAMSYEWTRMSEPTSRGWAFAVCFLGVFGAILAASWGYLGPAFGWLVACGAVSALRRRTVTGVLETFGGLLYVGAPCAMFLALRAQPGGREAVLSMFLIIWATDAAAYFAGALIGGPRVSRRLSPTKTWAGLIFGTLAGSAAGAGCAALFHGPGWLWAQVGAIIGATGLCGDLLESFLKRRFGVKDASGLIPGHGGFLDRLDGMITATVLTSAVLLADPALLGRLLEAPA